EELPWTSDDENVAKWRNYSHSRFCPDPNTMETSIQAVVGTGSAFESELDYRDLPRDVIVVIDHPRRSHHWMAPIDFDVAELQGRETETIGVVFGGDLHVLFADSVVWTLSEETPITELLKFTSIEGATTYERDEVLAPFRLK
ncbi:MAG: hypothetical protein KDA84_21585, partial [Planctomycetaceae bacterium]|nr:hypothetical protein [Planctomycetaceae bacterium]